MRGLPKMLLYPLSVMLFAMLSYMYIFLNMFTFNSLLNNVKAETDELYCSSLFIVSF